ncbi:flagellar export chaperone FliS [Sphingomonas sp. BIUV-7]|uniref:Flagellar export chaperone FliS n=1 Tax=Sphingomonas natans TaxID=3063330 RepID=A0ABT8YC03_9SPHN|nr:flagellar export chaperone FliS [Sphingomonas sp. BIUV-7]MDO6415849.1 flagellar export chaperone FliS [Sphingomonas sp. BIUV-7]
MFGAPSRYGAGTAARYRSVDVNARVEGASPHQLIVILFEELMKALDSLRAAEAAGDRGRSAPLQSRALSILHGLETGLDMDKGGEIALSLAKIYREARRLLNTSGPTRDAALEQARTMLAEVAGAWMSIG